MILIKWGKVAVLLVCTVHAIVDSDKPHALFHEQDFGIKANFQIITPKTRHVLDYQCRNFSVFNPFQEMCIRDR